MIRRPVLLAGSVALVFSVQSVAAAATFSESGDAGQTLGTAAQVSIADPTQIVGAVVAPDDADLFALSLTGGVSFTATSSSVGFAGGGIEDTQLFLFDAAGNGVRYNDDIDTTTFLSQIAFTPTASGLYYLGIAGVGFNPQDGAGNFIYQSDPFNPTALVGVSSAGPLASWDFVPFSVNDSGTYTISLAGAQPVPEPASTLGLALVAGLGYLSRRRSLSKR